MGPNDAERFGINLPTAMVIAAFCGIAWFNTIELQARIWLTFKKYTGLYFWSLVLSSWGCAIHALGFLFLDFDIIQQANAVGIIIGISWWCMVTGQALVLYSRLHLVVRDNRKTRWILAMIITNFCILHLPIMLVSQMAYSPVPHESKWMDVYNVFEKVQMTGFTIQETIISGVYLYEARKVLRPGLVFHKKRTGHVIKHLIWVNVFVIFLDAALLSTEFANLVSIQTVFKAAIYSIKLKFEVVVLNQLMEIVGGKAGVFSLTGTNASSGGGGGSQPIHNHQLGHISGHQRSQPGDTYDAFVSPGFDFQLHERKAGGVLRTTEVRIDGASEEEDDEIRPGPLNRAHGVIEVGERGPSRPDEHRPSLTSSEIDFATKGA